MENFEVKEKLRRAFLLIAECYAIITCSDVPKLEIVWDIERQERQKIESEPFRRTNDMSAEQRE